MGADRRLFARGPRRQLRLRFGDDRHRCGGPDRRRCDAYAQARQIIANIAAALERAGAQLGDVVRTRIFVTDISQWEAVGRAHGEAFGTIRPACTMVEVAKLIAPEIMLEIEADAIIGART